MLACVMSLCLCVLKLSVINTLNGWQSRSVCACTLFSFHFHWITFCAISHGASPYSCLLLLPLYRVNGILCTALSRHRQNRNSKWKWVYGFFLHTTCYNLIYTSRIFCFLFLLWPMSTFETIANAIAEFHLGATNFMLWLSTNSHTLKALRSHGFNSVEKR